MTSSADSLMSSRSPKIDNLITGTSHGVTFCGDRTIIKSLISVRQTKVSIALSSTRVQVVPMGRELSYTSHAGILGSGKFEQGYPFSPCATRREKEKVGIIRPTALDF